MKDKKYTSTMGGYDLTDAVVQTSTDGNLQQYRNEVEIVTVSAPSSFTSVPPLKKTSGARNKPKSKLDVFTLSPAEQLLLNELKLRYESAGVKIRKKQLLIGGLHLLSSLPMGKLLAVIGPLESPVTRPFIRKKKIRPPN